MGSYVLVSHQSQTCSSYCTKSCITTRTPWLGRRSVQSQSWREVRVQPPPAQPRNYIASPRKNVSRSRQCTEGRNWRQYKELLPNNVVSCLDNKEGPRLGCSAISMLCRRMWMTRKPRKRRHYM